MTTAPAPDDSTTKGASTRAQRHRWAGLVFISVAVSIIIVDSTIVNVAIPSIIGDLHISTSQVQWVQESYTLVFASLLLVFGSLADRLGRRRILLIGVVVFALSSILAASTDSGGWLIAARLVQGVGGAMILPTTLSLINATFSGRERGIAFAIWGSTIGGMTALGPLLGGWLTTDFTWRYAFGINVPIGIAVVIGVVLFVAESRDPGHASRIDPGGAVLSVITFASLVFGLIEGRTYGWWLPATSTFAVGSWVFSPIPVAFAVALVAGAAFVTRGIRRDRRGLPSMIAVDLFRIPSFRNGNVAALIVALGEFGIILSLPLWMQEVLGYSALQTGFVLLALAVGSFVASGFAGATSGRFSPVRVVRVGIVAEIVGVAGTGLVISATTEWWQIVPFLFVYGFGVGLATAQLTGVVLADVPQEQSGRASGTQSTSRQLGSALGIAVLGTILYSVAGTPSTAATFSAGARDSTFVAAAFLVVGLLATLRLGPGGQDRASTLTLRSARASNPIDS
ncbi:MFS transporter [Frondihabitans australicus]|uniref:EmrB/QacA subfamily drug resistance transporter n=1 Tax=Frondihabitans australicus TaxID=386892 RepID=A0A495IKK1_9MICO|nr:MFS transporter [Frondihabitans australicus]RKR76494.1 EmrB/QacA subfamily drug resistance transporter [Frondihabitans australicus]